MEEKVGAYIIDENGNLVPDPNDEAMVARHNLIKEDKKTVTKKEKEVRDVKTN